MFVIKLLTLLVLIAMLYVMAYWHGRLDARTEINKYLQRKLNEFNESNRRSQRPLPKLWIVREDTEGKQ